MSSLSDRRNAELQSRMERLETFIDEASRRLAAIEARLPRRKITAPNGCLGAQQAAHESGMSLSGFYRNWRKLGIIGVRCDSCLMFNPASLPVRKL
jgi:hypothetical protein